MNEIRAQLVQLRQRLRLIDGLDFVQRSLWLGCLSTLLILVAGRFWPIGHLEIWSSIPIAVWLVTLPIIYAFKPLPLLRVALRVDSALGLRERLSTSLVLEDIQANFPIELVKAQQEDALKVSKSINPVESFPLTWRRPPLIAAGIMVLTIGILILLPNPMEDILEQRASVAASAQEQSEKLEDLKDQIQDQEGLSLAERENLLRQLAELSEALKENEGDLESALTELSNAERTLQGKVDPNSAAFKSNLELMEEQLRSLAGIGSEPDIEQSAEVSDILSQMIDKMGSFSDEERQNLSQSLAQMAARSAQSGDMELATAIASLSQAIQSNDQEGAFSSAQTIQEALQDAQMRISDQEAIQQALSQISASRQALAQAGRPIAQLDSTDGQGLRGDGSGQNPGQGTASGQGQFGGGGGTRADTLPPATGQGRAVPPQGDSPSPRVSGPESQIYSPLLENTSDGEDLFIPGQDTGQGETSVRESQSPSPGTFNPALVPYDEVYYSYLFAAYQSIQQSQIPLELQEFVREYFIQLEP